MNIQYRLEQFLDDNPYDADTQAKRLMASDDADLIRYAIALGLTTAKARQRQSERDYIKNTGYAMERERLVPGRVTGSVVVKKIPRGKRGQNALRLLICDAWMIGDKMLGDATIADLSGAIAREVASAHGHTKNVDFYTAIKSRMTPDGGLLRKQLSEDAIRKEIESVYGEFRTREAA
jgi:hypothetical protein